MKQCSMAGKSERWAYYSMLGRCYNKNVARYKYYGGRGITVCERWRQKDGLYNFLEDVGPKPNPKYSLDRIDVNGNYEPDNVRWVSQSVQHNNRTNNTSHPGVKLVNIRGNLYWRSVLMVNRITVHQKYFKTFEDALAARKVAEIKWLGDTIRS